MLEVFAADTYYAWRAALRDMHATASFPFVSKVLGVNFIEVATKAICGLPQTPRDLMSVPRDYQAVKVRR